MARLDFEDLQIVFSGARRLMQFLRVQIRQSQVCTGVVGASFFMRNDPVKTRIISGTD